MNNVNRNEQYFNEIKNDYTNLNNFIITKNFFVYSENNNHKFCSLENLSLESIDKSLFNLEPKEIFYVIKNISNSINQPTALTKRINYTTNLITALIINNEEQEYLKAYLQDIYSRKNIQNKFRYYGDLEELIDLEKPINIVFDQQSISYDYPASTYLRELITKYHEEQLENSNGSQKEKDYVRTLKSKHSIIQVEQDYANIAGFMNTTLIISIVSMLGIIIAIILFAIKFK